jgi:ADP-heptose:LPS heptosyltransferase
MGDVVMSTPAFRALKETFGCRLTLLTSEMGSLIAPFVKQIDETIVFDLPWVKTNTSMSADKWVELIEKLKAYHFDAAIIFTVYSQNPLPSALMAYMADIPLRLAYCRENPYDLLTDWIPDKEPYNFIQHQVKRDLYLVKYVEAITYDEYLSLQYRVEAFETAIDKLSSIGFNAEKEFIIAHAGVSEAKRQYPEPLWIEALNIITQKTDLQVLLTGAKNEQQLTNRIRHSTCDKVFAVAELLSLEESIAIIANSSLVISVNTSTIHIASAFKKPVVVLYAETNPQHTPWLTENAVLPFSVPQKLRSKNAVIEFVNEYYYKRYINYPSSMKVAEAALRLLSKSTRSMQLICSS